jgi:HEAT repeat protein
MPSIRREWGDIHAKIYRRINDKARPEWWKSVVALEKMRKPAVEYLELALRHEDKWVRQAAADVLGNIGDPCCVDHLIGSLEDHEQDVKFATAEALGKLGGPKTCSALNAACTQDNGYVNIAAEEALTKLNH